MTLYPCAMRQPPTAGNDGSNVHGLVTKPGAGCLGSGLRRLPKKPKKGRGLRLEMSKMATDRGQRRSRVMTTNRPVPELEARDADR